MAAQIDMDNMLAKIKDRQWALADIDWDAPGAETITDEMRPKLKAFIGWLGAAESSLKGLAPASASRGSKRNSGQWPDLTAISCWRWL